ncbi:putative metallo-hydrolase YycJ [Brevibacillus centrosporus]|uniref:MBL fold metallo-hydrolase n=1 Tax=Brevibacillus centrosporus TaxID=54910 RepID=UPI001172FA9E|nr:MBL fold metallo-hydrolase [Brevibacillus centrosporus]GED35050.1 putative metallo-hydrolase YycJ [Brevibacillus centrosporus]
MIKVDILASGSGGNCVALTSEQKTVLIDAGVAKTKIEKRLLEVGIRPDEVAGIFVTHAHGDHIRGLPLANKYRIPVFATYGEWKGIAGVDEELQHIVSTLHGLYEKIELGGFLVHPFQTHHDAYEPVGYAVEDDRGDRCCVVFDTGHVDSYMLEMMEGNCYIIEANHEPAMVEAGDYPDTVKARILSDNGHLSNEQTAAALQRLIQGRGERIYLTHLSSKNNLPALAEMTVKQALRKIGYAAGKHYTLEVLA